MEKAKSHYIQVKVSVAPELATSFKAACAMTNVSMASVISRYMAEYSCSGKQHGAGRSTDYTTRRKRRKILRQIIRELVQIKAAEEYLIGNAPDNLQDAPIYLAADEYVSILDDVIEQLGMMVP